MGIRQRLNVSSLLLELDIVSDGVSEGSVLGSFVGNIFINEFFYLFR